MGQVPHLQANEGGDARIEDLLELLLGNLARPALGSNLPMNIMV
jgi:hypothetical protein